MNFNGFTANEIAKFGGIYSQDDETNLPVGAAIVAQNVDFSLTSVRTRYGIKKQFQTGSLQPVSGGASLEYINVDTGVKTQYPLVYDMAGNIFVESPVGSGTLVNVKSLAVTTGPPNSSSLVSLPATHLRVAAAFNRGYFAFTDLKAGQALPAVWDMATNRLDPVSMKLAGQVFAANTAYSVGELICPTAVGGNGHTYSVTVAGTSGTEPVWPTTTGATVTSGGVTFKENTLAVQSSASSGNICSGQRYAFVLFENYAGYITGMTAGAVISFNIASNGFALKFTNVPTGPSNTAKRIICLSPSVGGSTPVNSSGPFWYIASNDVSNGIAMSSTVIADNTTTSLDGVTFTDDYLINLQLTNVTANFRIIQVPACSDIFFARSQQRMVYTVPGTGFYLSLQNDPETVYGDTGKVLVAVNNGDKEVCWGEWRGKQFAFKENSAYIVTPNANEPTQWDAQEEWIGSGPCGPQAIDYSTKFFAYVHRSGVYVFHGNKPVRINKEIPAEWGTINWNFQQLIWLMIDEETRTIRIGAPTGSNTYPDTIFKLNYEETDGESIENETFMSEGIHLTMFGKLMARAVGARKWSLDTGINAMFAFRAERTLSSPGVGGAAYQQSQILFCSALNDGAVHAMVPNQYDDNGAAIDCVYETSAPQNLMKVSRVGGVQANINGNGQAFFTLLGGRAVAGTNSLLEIDLPFAAQLPTDKGYACGARGLNERWRLRITNGKTADNWFTLKWAAIYAAPVFSARTSSGN